MKIYSESLRLIDWFNTLSEKLPHGDDFRVGHFTSSIQKPVGKILFFVQFQNGPRPILTKF